MNQKFAKLFAFISVMTLTIVTTVVPVFAANPDTGDKFNLPLMLGIAGGALLLIIITLVLTGKKGKNKKK
ncbi:hypothetical protein [Hydrogenoanaerobacterium sp.]|uniref:hypothetical protein n=1 Tax=Hydrogenoanaerobacterium sp. TaxID=2953763 RepID=UPI00289E89FC|nr:hypothetical protein [Hydrogenoanaerobacterium sp.]